MPRQSAASLAFGLVDGMRPHIVPPAGMSKEARKVFVGLVAANPPQHFAPSDAPLIAGYAEVICQAEAAACAIARDGAVLADGTVNPWISIQRGALRTMTVLAHRLRLSPSARSSARTTGRGAERHLPMSYYDQIKAEGAS
jgi:phage terminase small subunit